MFKLHSFVALSDVFARNQAHIRIQHKMLEETTQLNTNLPASTTLFNRDTQLCWRLGDTISCTYVFIFSQIRVNVGV